MPWYSSTPTLILARYATQILFFAIALVPAAPLAAWLGDRPAIALTLLITAWALSALVANYTIRGVRAYNELAILSKNQATAVAIGANALVGATLALTQAADATAAALALIPVAALDYYTLRRNKRTPPRHHAPQKHHQKNRRSGKDSPAREHRRTHD